MRLVSEASSMALHALRLLMEGPMTVDEMASRMGASRNHLAKVMMELRRRGIVRSRRGPRGGFELARDPGAISVLEVVEAVEGRFDASGCPLGLPGCPFARCLFGALREISVKVRSFMEGTTISQLGGVEVGEEDRDRRGSL